jgi:prepilin-type N-terminal cleavage/methylation domain-containing protein
MRMRIATPTRGFTLIELLVVIMIIVLLVTMAMPSFMAVRDIANEQTSRTQLRTLANGADSYKSEYRLYPGQRYPDLLTGSDGDYTGSQYLAASIWDYSYADIHNETFDDDPNEGPSSRFTSYKVEFLLDWDRASPENRGRNTCSDMYGPEHERMPFLYFPARQGIADVGQFKEDDNAAYLLSSTFDHWERENAESDEWDDFLHDKRGGWYEGSIRKPYNNGKFLLIGAGSDREYGTEDDIRNW